MRLLRSQRVEILRPQAQLASKPVRETILSRAQRAHTRLSWEERLARNARAKAAGPVYIKLFGVPDQFADFLGLQSA